MICMYQLTWTFLCAVQTQLFVENVFLGIIMFLAEGFLGFMMIQFIKIKDDSAITDKDRMDWLEDGNGLCALVSTKFPRGIAFTANFERQDWDEAATAREAIDIAMHRKD